MIALAQLETFRVRERALGDDGGGGEAHSGPSVGSFEALRSGGGRAPWIGGATVGFMILDVVVRVIPL